MKNLKWVFVFLGLAGLISVRIVEDSIFYDPLLAYFHEANNNIAFPDFDWAKLLLSYLFRFSLNLLFSTLIIHFIFLNKSWTVQAVVMMLLVFAIAFPLYLFCLYNQFTIGYLFSFFVRRLVIQPMVVLLIVPLYYYRKSQLR
jgi:exosortase F-associated protein